MGTRPYKVFGEGKERKSGLYREKYNYNSTDIRLTCKDKLIYCCPESKQR